MFRKLLILFFYLFPLVAQGHDASITFLIADLKYNEERGIQVCEIQQGSISVYSGHAYVHNDGRLIGRLFCDSLEKFHHSFYFSSGDVMDSNLTAELRKRGWKILQKKQDLIQNISKPPNDPSSIGAYHAVLYCQRTTAQQYRTYPGALIIDKLFNPYASNKKKVSELFRDDSFLEQYKPKWGAFPCKYSPGLVDTIKKNIPSDLVVIKPLAMSLGGGVIILHKNDLDSTLKYIFKKSHKLRHDPDRSYSAWYYNKHTEFVVEEFVPSDPVYVSHLGNKPYDGTIRAIFIAYCDQGTIIIDPLGMYWKFPEYPLDREGTLHQKHKVTGVVPRFALLDPIVEKEVVRQLADMATRLIEKMQALAKPKTRDSAYNCS